MKKIIIILSTVAVIISTGILACNSSRQPSKHNEGITDTSSISQGILKWHSQ